MTRSEVQVPHRPPIQKVLFYLEIFLVDRLIHIHIYVSNYRIKRYGCRQGSGGITMGKNSESNICARDSYIRNYQELHNMINT